LGITLEIAVIAPDVARAELLKVVKLLLLIFCVEAELPVVDSTVIPWIVPDVKPCVKAIVLLFIELVKVPVGATVKDGIKIPLNVAEVVIPPFELVILL
jgi:hypothetical protein